MDIERVLKKQQRRPLFDTQHKTMRPLDLAGDALKALLPHREPFLLIDRIHGIDIENRGAWAERHLDRTDPIFGGHFPGAPLLPGVLQVEMIGQLAIAYLALESSERKASDRLGEVRLSKILHARFLHEVKPGDAVEVQAKVLDEDAYCVRGIGQTLVAGKVCAVAAAELYLF